ncbi:HNH endonuclease [Thermoanaerobacterium saccharolyticum]|uniref:HNH endonuclease n=1 Tax=Thermoanaerobacterium saccharolyticum TaxID=28896 RepID=UPI0009E51607
MNAHNFCSAACRNQWLGKYNAEVINVAGHSKGHKARYLTELNARRNPLCRIAENPKTVKSSAYRSIIEKHIGRRLNGSEIVHHINGNRSDNRIENLKIMSPSEHTRLHMQAAIKKYRELFEGGGD